MTEILLFVLAWSVRVAIAALIAGVVVTLLRRRSAATRHFVWRIALLLAALLPLIMVSGPRIAAPVAANSPVSQIFSPRPSAKTASASADPAPSPLAASTTSVAPSEAPFDPWTIAFAIYLGGGSLIVLRWLHGLLQIRRLAKSATPFNGNPRMLIGRDSLLKVPVTFGFRRPLILLPSDAPEWPEVRLAAAVLHEEAHIRRFDWAAQSFGTLLCAIHWFNPAVWILSAKLRSTAEDAADDEVLASGLQPTAYASALLDVAASVQRPLTAGVGMVRRRGVAARLRSILATGRDRRVPGRSFGWSMAFSMLCVGALIGGITFAQSVPAIRQDETGQHPLTASFGHGKPFYGPVRLRDGSTLKVAFVQSDSKSGHEIWRPDGSAAPKSDVDRSLGMIDYPGQTSPYRRMYVRVDSDRPRADTSYEVRVPHPSDWNVWQSYGDGKRNLDMVTFHAPRSLIQTDFKVGVASGPYRVHSSAPIETGDLHPVITPYKSDGAVAGNWVPPTVTAIVRIPKDAEGKDIQVALHTKDDRKLELKVYETQDSVRDGFPTRSFSFGGADPGEIVSVDLLVRDYEWVTFRGIRLYPRR